MTAWFWVSHLLVWLIVRVNTFENFKETCIACSKIFTLYSQAKVCLNGWGTLESQTFQSTPSVPDSTVQWQNELFSPRLYSPELFSPRPFSLELFSPRPFSPEIFSPRLYSPMEKWTFQSKTFQSWTLQSQTFQSWTFQSQTFQS